MKIRNYELKRDSLGRIWLTTPNGCSSLVVFYHSPEETKELHKQNLKHGWSLSNQMKGIYNQLLGLDYELCNKAVYTRVVNAYIKNEIN